ncbi:Uma2 family endonuclease [Fontivita pretiosa]|uniref:Uma2 family endonuclease n=1 Tax=Fontivita pretiosa TaxID=2989684 RepID=UPI003D163C23
MTQPAEKHRSTIEEYLRLDRDSTERHEYRDGAIVAMAGRSHDHTLIAANLIAEIRNALKGKPCRAYGSDLKVAITKRRRITCPDGSIICGPPEFHPAAAAARDVVANPRVLIEVLSPSTEHYDRTEKFDVYREIDSFEEYVLVGQLSARVETYRRFPDGSWHFEVFAGIQATAQLGSVGIAIPLGEIYAGIEMPVPQQTDEVAPDSGVGSSPGSPQSPPALQS